MQESQNPYDPPKTPVLASPGLPRRSWMRFVPAVVCVLFGVYFLLGSALIVWKTFAAPELVRYWEVHPVLRALPFWAGLFLGTAGIALFVAAVYWVRGRYARALLLSAVTLMSVRLAAEIVKRVGLSRPSNQATRAASADTIVLVCSRTLDAL